jgi:putative membrane protein
MGGRQLVEGHGGMLWLKALHIIAFAAWMAGMWYLPRLLVYHADAGVGSELSETLKVMERRLSRAIMAPAMVATLGFGLWLAIAGGWWAQGWLHLKLLLVVLLLATHGLLVREARQLAADRRHRPARFYRIVNEVPTVLFIGIVLLAVIKPF